MCVLYCCTLQRWSTPPGGRGHACPSCACHHVPSCAVCRDALIFPSPPVTQQGDSLARACAYASCIYKVHQPAIVLPMFYQTCRNPFVYGHSLDSVRIWTAFFDRFLTDLWPTFDWPLADFWPLSLTLLPFGLLSLSLLLACWLACWPAGLLRPCAHCRRINAPSAALQHLRPQIYHFPCKVIPYYGKGEKTFSLVKVLRCS